MTAAVALILFSIYSCGSPANGPVRFYWAALWLLELEAPAYR